MKFVTKLLALLLIIITLSSLVSCDIIDKILPGVGGGSNNGQTDTSFYIDGPVKIDLKVGESRQLILVENEPVIGEVIWTSSDSCVSVEDGRITALSEGVSVVKATLGDLSDRVLVNVVPDSASGGKDEDTDDGRGNTVIVPGTEDPVTSDPYVNVDEDEFYANYTPAISYMDAYYRSKHNLMSGSIYEQDQKPTISDYQPKSNGKLVRNDTYIFSEDGNTYYVVDCYGEIAFEIYKGGAYVVLEEVAAYVFAFGEPPANHSESKKTKPTQSGWGEYLRVNNTKFSGDTSKYPYEPVLPRISGCGGDLTYYEMDIGTTGTDTGNGYAVKVYNDGTKITRGAARIVYSCKDKNGNNIIDLDERYVFYTYNHYNDFQEYLNYEGGWGEMFGNVTGGGSLSSTTNYNPTPYVSVARSSLKEGIAIYVVYCIIPKNEYAA